MKTWYGAESEFPLPFFFSLPVYIYVLLIRSNPADAPQAIMLYIAEAIGNT